MSLMAAEAREAPEACQRFLERNAAALAELGARLRRSGPPLVLTSARGSSDHAAGYFKYLCEIRMGIPCASVGASVVSVYGARLKAASAMCLTISQSGQSPDILALQEAAKAAGAISVAIVNVEDSPAARNADVCLALDAGIERSVAATKSFIASCVAGAAIVAHWSGDEDLLRAVAGLPHSLAEAAALSWEGFTDFAGGAGSLFVLGRGPSLPMAQETALKLKETCAIHAEAYSVAEVMHGPWEIMETGFPVLVYAPADAARETTREAVEKMRRAGADVRVVGDGGLAHARTGHPLLDPLSIIQTAYLEIERVAAVLGRDPDRPRLLKKVTETL
jgi:glucosamine--fructose-6-phosphate aminotransferase (isomerizing)